MEKIITFNNVYANYSDGIALSDISFDINVGEMGFIMGPTGAGKSSVLRAIYKDLNISSGNIFFEDTDITNIMRNKVSFFRRKIGIFKSITWNWLFRKYKQAC